VQGHINCGRDGVVRNGECTEGGKGLSRKSTISLREDVKLSVFKRNK